MLDAAQRALKLDSVATTGLIITLILGCAFPILWFLSIVFLILKIYVRKAGVILLDYDIDDDLKSEVENRVSAVFHILQSDKIWRIMKTSKVKNKKYSGGASGSVDRVICKTSTSAPFPFKSNVETATFKSGKEILVFLPDKLFLIQKRKIGALNYSDISTSVSATKFIESGTVPKDAKVVEKTWKYVNKSGGPDKRFKDNKELPVCVYGELTLKSETGLNTVIMFSNTNSI